MLSILKLSRYCYTNRLKIHEGKQSSEAIIESNRTKIRNGEEILFRTTPVAQFCRAKRSFSDVVMSVCSHDASLPGATAVSIAAADHFRFLWGAPGLPFSRHLERRARYSFGRAIKVDARSERRTSRSV